jgi:hypothetical protein
VDGSAGQRRIHPAVNELRQARQLLARLLAQLGLPDESGQAVVETFETKRARSAANERWRMERQRRDGRSA